ncbi:4'-phosphopantetheinyl transferase EntD (siderophore biosynthesis) [Rhizobium sp. RU35A]|uniref:4'-phosphopantetheinyl transferase family protein n=1 Tax=Rhizobium sp. RU35A TaxID=1907414 RepID=UPI0009569968|nr:4'-phosphopantetheinyl transferase superfamily protein [Rhizobium sp. RU35A]SIQ45388.1 4'-phosphopantetheinyl transferase EntD (siderophore biosynthesis) [Rhizobium sp. RU35A]
MIKEAGEAALHEAMQGLTLPCIRLGCRRIRAGDAGLLLPEETATIAARQPSARQASGAARALARHLMEEEGLEAGAIIRSAAGSPVWPAGVTGSLAHDDEMAVAVIARRSAVLSVGIDVEPAAPLPDDVVALVQTAADVVTGTARNLATRLLFSAKEAVYKACYPLHETILDYPDIRIDLARGEAITITGFRAGLRFCLSPRIVVLAVAFDPA